MSKDGETKPAVQTEVPESEKILEQINALKAGKTPPEIKPVEAVAEVKPTESESKTQEKATQPTAEQQPAPNGKAEDTKAQDDKKSGKPEVDIREWAKRKGFKENDQESVLKAYREMERKLSQINATQKSQDINVQNVPRGTNEQPGYQPNPQWQPAPQVPQWQPPYQPPTYPPQNGYPPPYVDRRAILEAEAARFNMLPEDLEKFLPLVNEVTELKLNRERQLLQQKYDRQLSELNAGNKRNAEFNDLMADPLFTTPEVAFEIDQIMSENPMRLKLEPTPWTNMFKDALERIARKNLQEKTAGSSNNQEESSSQLPKNPPKGGGRGTSPVIPTNNAPGALLEKFKTLDVAEMEKQLAQIGAIPPRS